MKRFILAVIFSLISGCTFTGDYVPDSSRESPNNIGACTDTYNDVNQECANAITPQGY